MLKKLNLFPIHSIESKPYQDCSEDGCKTLERHDIYFEVMRFFLAAYLLFTAVLLLNMIIAVFM